jgi:immune inhibitor A
MANLLEDIKHIYEAARRSEDGERCCVAPSPEIQEKMRDELRQMRSESDSAMPNRLGFRGQKRVGFNDGLTVPGTELPLGTPPSVARSVALKRAPMMPKTMNVVVVMVQFSDKPLASDRKQYFEDLFFSTGKVATGSVHEYYTDVTGRRPLFATQNFGTVCWRRVRHRQRTAKCSDYGKGCCHPCK